jgi:hypothetical protein
MKLFSRERIKNVGFMALIVVSLLAVYTVASLNGYRNGREQGYENGYHNGKTDTCLITATLLHDMQTGEITVGNSDEASTKVDFVQHFVLSLCSRELEEATQ